MQLQLLHALPMLLQLLLLLWAEFPKLLLLRLQTAAHLAAGAAVASVTGAAATTVAGATVASVTGAAATTVAGAAVASVAGAAATTVLLLSFLLVETSPY